MGISSGKIKFSTNSREAKYHEELKKDMLDFLTKINSSALIFDKDIIITQAEILMVRSINYDAINPKDIPFLESQIPPAYEKDNNERKLSDYEFRDYIKRVSFYFQYFLECK